jgi:hypothetical protein
MNEDEVKWAQSSELHRGRRIPARNMWCSYQQSERVGLITQTILKDP